MADPVELIQRLTACQPGSAGWQAFEDACVEILSYLFVPPLERPRVQARSFSGIDRRDAVFPNRNINGSGSWAHIYLELGARMILCEFKNYDLGEVGKEEVDQTRNYLRPHWGRLALMVCNKVPNESAHLRRNTLFSDHKTVVLFLTPVHLEEMIHMKERGEDPGNLILDLLELFYLQHE